VRVFNFAAGPAALPLEVLEQARDEMTEWRGSGMSVMEVSHRSKAFVAVATEAEADLRELLSIPAGYKVLFLQGGATGQFSAIPMNLTQSDSHVDYVNTGAWSKKALLEARRYCNVAVAADAKASDYTSVPSPDGWKLNAGAAYLHYTANETIGGVEFPFVPQVQVPLVSDMSSTILSRPIDVSRFGVIYAGAQKNIGPSGVTVVIARKDIVDAGRKDIPTIFRYATHAANNSLYNTPPTFGIYLARNVLAYVKEIGGLAEVERRNRKKGEVLYGAIDAQPDFFRASVEKDSRSLMNVVFRLPSEELEKKFVAEALKQNMVGLAGHRSTGGIRVSTYNAVTIEMVETLVAFMKDFAKRS
jgi:phosphoserine aminotransferase